MHAIIFMSSSSLPLPSAANSPATQTQATAGTVDHVSSASLPRTVWGNGFLDHRFDYASLQANHKQPKHEVLKQEVRKMVIDYDVKSGDSESHIADKLRLIDAVQRLGVGYHFEKEIGEVLERVDDLGDDLFSNIGDKGSDLYHAALRFRLLRQQGFPVSPDGFRKLKGSEGKFKEWLAKDEKGLLSLYEATHMAFNGEDILDELQSFATKTLESIFPHNITNPSFQKQIDFALRVPAWKCVPRSLARHSIDFYSMDSFHHEKLLAFAKMDVRALQELPDRMRNVYSVILNLYDEIEKETGKIGPTFGVQYAKAELKKLSQAYLGEVRWRNEGRVPTLREYIINGVASSGVSKLCTSCFVGMGAEIATKKAFEWVTNESKMMNAGCLIARVQNDIFSHEFEQKRNHVASAVECCMKEYRVSEKEAVEFLWKEISNAWKDIVEEYCQKPTLLPSTDLTDRLLNLTRLINIFYDNGDCLINSHLLKDHLTSLFIDPVPL
ncbi:unnamed protein product [Linum tenue]|uniref:Uncharacterized protein n=1 Tax=Linum tenue TaxID=586396 RepID=A0AAV0NDD3_9ROSI|nr:unnamed protein product [Linum tenue]